MTPDRPLPDHLAVSIVALDGGGGEKRRRQSD
jgi:hypothetical protein